MPKGQDKHKNRKSVRHTNSLRCLVTAHRMRTWVTSLTTRCPTRLQDGRALQTVWPSVSVDCNCDRVGLDGSGGLLGVLQFHSGCFSCFVLSRIVGWNVFIKWQFYSCFFRMINLQNKGFSWIWCVYVWVQMNGWWSSMSRGSNVTEFWKKFRTSAWRDSPVWRWYDRRGNILFDWDKNLIEPLISSRWFLVPYLWLKRGSNIWGVEKKRRVKYQFGCLLFPGRRSSLCLSLLQTAVCFSVTPVPTARGNVSTETRRSNCSCRRSRFKSVCTAFLLQVAMGLPSAAMLSELKACF
jgi:hypothetical protein